MKTIKFALLIIFSVFLISSCKKFLDVNHNPNVPEDVPMETVLPAAIENAASVIGSSYLILGEIWSEHWTSDANAPDYQTEDSYNVTAGDYSYDIAGWSNIYPNAMMDLEWIRNKAKEDSNWTYYLVATVFQSYIFQFMADFYDQIPFSEAFKGLPPHFENGYDVYDSLIVRIDDAIQKYESCSECPKIEEGDLIFNGDMDKWIEFANTLKLKIYLREVYKRPTVAQQGIEKLAQEGAKFLTVDAKFDDFADEAGRDNYVYGREYRGRGNINLRASKTLIDLLKYYQDPRLDYIFLRPRGEEDDIDNHRGMYQGDYRNVYSYPGQDVEISRPRVTALTPTYFITAAESYFLQAEASVRFNNVFGDPTTLYQKAIEADFSRLMQNYKGDPINANESLGDIDYHDVLNKRYYGDFDPNTMPTDTLIKRIIVQKWIAMANIQGHEAFFEHNRTGYPENSPVQPGDPNFASEYKLGEFTVSVTGVLPKTNPYPKRLMFPSTEQSRNPNTPKVQPLYKPVWWDPTSDYTSSK